MNREQMLAALSEQSTIWDVVVIGGGATGLGAALDAVSRGHRTALVEAHDFAKGTSSRSTKLIHGGVRYLQQGQLRMVKESLRERGRLLRNAPHIVHPLDFVIPTFRTGQRLYYYAGMKAYDFLAGKQGFHPSRMLSRMRTAEILPTLKPDHLRGGVLYSDGQFDDARLAVALAQSIVTHGGIAANYTPVVGLRCAKEGVAQVIAHDAETGCEFPLQARVVINATGVFGTPVMEMDAAEGASSRSNRPSIVPSRGSHLVLDRGFLPGNAAMLIPKTDDGRVLFAIPWHGKTLLGTTDLAEQHVELDPRPTESEIDYLLEHAGRYLTRAPCRSDIRSMFCGLRPLVGKGAAGTSSASLSREHEIHVSDRRLISVIGGKWTTYRKMGEDIIDLAEKVGGLKQELSRTASLQLHGAPAANQSLPAAETDSLHGDETITPELAAYGSDAVAIRSLERQQPELSRKLHADVSAAQIVWAVEHEMARTVEDALARRTRLLLLDARAAVGIAAPVASIMAKQLGHDADWQDRQTATFTQLAAMYIA